MFQEAIYLSIISPFSLSLSLNFSFFHMTLAFCYFRADLEVRDCTTIAWRSSRLRRAVFERASARTENTSRDFIVPRNDRECKLRLSNFYKL